MCGSIRLSADVAHLQADRARSAMASGKGWFLGALAYGLVVPVAMWAECTTGLTKCTYASDAKFAEIIGPAIFVGFLLFATGLLVALGCDFGVRLCRRFIPSSWLSMWVSLVLGTVIGAIPLFLWGLVTLVGHPRPDEVYLLYADYLPFLAGGAACSLVLLFLVPRRSVH